MNAFIFDLDGVIVDTAKYHYIAWREIGASFNFKLSESQNENLKGISRADSLDLLLKWGETDLDADQKKRIAGSKKQPLLRTHSRNGER